MRTFKKIISTGLAVLLVSVALHLPVLPSPAYAGGDGGGGSFSTEKKPAKSKKSKFKIYAESIEDTYRTRGMGYYFERKSRMRRILQRLYEEDKAGQKDMKRMLKKIVGDGLGLKDSEKYKPGWAFSILATSEAYNDYKNGKITKASYEEQAKQLINFVP